MRKLLLLFLIVLACSTVFGQEVEKKDYSEVLNIELGKDLKGQTVTIDAEFFGFGMASMRKPNKFKFGYMPFRCNEIGEEPLKNGFGGETGHFFFIKKKNEFVDVVKKLKKGDKITLTGEVYVNNYFGLEQVNLIVHKVSKI